jgi:hypothetical protein
MKITKEQFEEEFEKKFIDLKMTENYFKKDCTDFKFEKIGSISQKVHKFKSKDRKDKEVLSPEFKKDNDDDEIATLENFCYLWVLKTGSDYFMLYIGQTSKTFETRFNDGHRRACREEELSNKNIRLMYLLDGLDRDKDEVQVWVRKSDEITLFYETVFLRKVEEDALINRYDPYLNA